MSKRISHVLYKRVLSIRVFSWNKITMKEQQELEEKLFWRFQMIVPCTTLVKKKKSPVKNVE